MNKDITISIDTIKRHAKRLHKVLQEENITSPDFKLTNTQTIFAKALGCNNWHELNEVLKNGNTNRRYILNDKLSNENTSTKFFEGYPLRSGLCRSAVELDIVKELDNPLDLSSYDYLNQLNPAELYNLLCNLINKKSSNLHVLLSYLKVIVECLVYDKETYAIMITCQRIEEFGNINHLIEVYKNAPLEIQSSINEFAILAFEESITALSDNLNKNPDYIFKHMLMWNQIMTEIKLLKKLEHDDIVIFDKSWVSFLYSIANETYNFKEDDYKEVYSHYTIPELTKNKLKSLKNIHDYEEVWLKKLGINNKSSFINKYFLCNKDFNERYITLRDIVLLLVSPNLNELELGIIHYLLKNYNHIKTLSEKITFYYNRKPVILVIEKSLTICRAIQLYAGKNYDTVFFNNLNEAKNYFKNLKESNEVPIVVLCESSILGQLAIKDLVKTHFVVSNEFKDEYENIRALIIESNKLHNHKAGTYLTKPFTKDEATSVIENVLKN